MSYSKYFLINNNEPDYNFISWIDNVEKLVFESYGVNLLDLPDKDYMYYYENNYQPDDMFKKIQEFNGFTQSQKRKKHNN